MKTGRHLCFLSETLNAMGGAEHMTAIVANALAEQERTVSILSLFGPASCFPLHPRVHHEALVAQWPWLKHAHVATVAGIRSCCRSRQGDVLMQVDIMLLLFTLPSTAGLGVEQIAWDQAGEASARMATAARHDASAFAAEKITARWNGLAAGEIARLVAHQTLSCCFY
ncbi:hypothetical protein [Cupriavidus sp. CP313]